MNNNIIANEIRDAIKQGDISKVKELLNKNSEMLTYMTPFGTWLHVAASYGKIEIIKYLIDSGFDIDIKGGTFDSGAINLAAGKGYFEIVEYLINSGAELDVSEPERNPLFAAIIGGNINIVKLLINNGIDVNIKYNGESMKDMDAYAFALENGQKEISEFLKS